MDPKTRLAIEAEIDALLKKSQSSQLVKLRRVIIRLARIAFGAVVFALGLFIWNLGPDVGETPLSALTLKDLFQGAAAVGFACIVFFWAWLAAFGAGPTRQEQRERFRAMATQVVSSRTGDLSG